MKILFCNIGWSKAYHGSTEDDRLQNGGSYVDERGDGNEAYNFSHVNRKYYGYVQANGNISIERIDGKSHKNAHVSDVLVVWMASKPKTGGTYIVGWYKHATVHREMQFYDATEYDEHNAYYAACDVRDGVLLPVERRTFLIPNAMTAGKGKGRGRSNLWYADSLYAQNEIVPKVIAYIDGYEGPSADRIYSPEELARTALDARCKTAEDFVHCAENAQDAYEELCYINAAWALAPTEEICRMQAEILISLGYLNEADAACRCQMVKDPLAIQAEYLHCYIMMILKDYDAAVKAYRCVRDKLMEHQALYLERLGTDEFDTMRVDALFMMADGCIQLRRAEEAEGLLNGILVTATKEEDLSIAKEMLRELKAALI